MNNSLILEENSFQRQIKLARALIRHKTKNNIYTDTTKLQTDKQQEALNNSLPTSPLKTSYIQPKNNIRLLKGHSSSITSITLSRDDRIVFSGSSDGVLMRWDVEKMRGKRINKNYFSAKCENKAEKKRITSLASTSDGHLIASGGNDNIIHLYDTRTEKRVISFPGHKGTITGLVFRDESHEIYSSSIDKTVKIWSIHNGTYINTLFGHRAPVLCLDCCDQGRPLSGASDQSCRIWKLDVGSQSIFKTSSLATHCCEIVTNSQWLSGDQDGNVSLWNSLKKEPIYKVCLASTSFPQHGAGSIKEPCTRWVSSIACCKEFDIISVGLGDGSIRLMTYTSSSSRHTALKVIDLINVRGFVNDLKIAKSARFVIAGVGQEQRLGRWGVDRFAKNGLYLQTIDPMSKKDHEYKYI